MVEDQQGRNEKDYTTDNRKASDRSWPVQSFVVPCMEMHNKD